uniref:Uncharacterized protein n=1 Tax=Lepeophtheirus salmonis TaxID=72036 RepID=A0A0K2V085_LEPSM
MLRVLKTDPMTRHIISGENFIYIISKKSSSPYLIQ